jgi:hypothetical protein
MSYDPRVDSIGTLIVLGCVLVFCVGAVALIVVTSYYSAAG